MSSETSSPSTSFVRGSSLLMSGRLISLAINFAAQVVIVRYLSKSGYAAYALALTTLVSNAASPGFQTTGTRA